MQVFKRGVAETHQALAELQKGRDGDVERMKEQDARIGQLEIMVSPVVLVS